MALPSLGMLASKRTVLALLIVAIVLLWVAVNNSSLSSVAYKYLALVVVALVGIIAIKLVR
jgi:hypothetical protein